MHIAKVALLGTLLFSISNALNEYTFLGPVFPAPVGLASSKTFVSALDGLTADLEATFTSAKGGPEANSIAIRAASIHDEEAIFEYYRTASELSPKGAQTVGPDTIFRIGSISKLFTVYELLLRGNYTLMDDLVQKYVPELTTPEDFDPIYDVDWDAMTVEALAAQMAGILRDCKFNALVAWMSTDI